MSLLAKIRRPRRIARVFELDRDPLAAGTPEQQQAVRAAFDKYIEYDNRFDRVLYALDKDVNKVPYKHYVPISFVDLEGWLGRAFPGHIYLSEDLIHLERTLLHEVGHVVGWRLFNPIDKSEQWARSFRYWVQVGMPDTPTWDRLKTVVKS